MNDWINILLSPYYHNSFYHIILEFTAVTFTIFSVFCAQKNNIWVYPIGIVSTIIYSYLTFVTSLYGDFIINLYYTLMSFYGWYTWMYKKKKKYLLLFAIKKIIWIPLFFFYYLVFLA